MWCIFFCFKNKTFEAPLSLFFQFYAAFYVNENLAAFVSLWVSMLFSIVGIANGIYIYNHLTPFDLDLLEEEELSEMPPSTIGVSSLSPRNPSTSCFTTTTWAWDDASQNRSCHHHLGWASHHQKWSKEGNLDQFVSDTEWKQGRFGPIWYHVTIVIIVTIVTSFAICKDRWWESSNWAKRAPTFLGRWRIT